MELPSWINGEVFNNMGYWVITCGAWLALLIGFKLSSSWGNGGLPLTSEIFILVLVPVASYFITNWQMNK